MNGVCPTCGYCRPQGVVALIQATVAAHYNIPDFEMWSERRNRKVSHPRQVAMYLTRELTPKSLPGIGRLFGKRDHTTVMWAIEATERRIATDPDVAADVATIRGRLAA